MGRSTCDSLKPNPLSGDSIVQLLAAAVVLKHGQYLGAFAVKDAVDGMFARDVLDLAAAEFILAGQDYVLVAAPF